MSALAERGMTWHARESSGESHASCRNQEVGGVHSKKQMAQVFAILHRVAAAESRRVASGQR